MERNEIKKMIPHGYKKEVAKKAGVGICSVSRFLSGKLNSHKIETACLEIIAELNQERKKLLKRIN